MKQYSKLTWLLLLILVAANAAFLYFSYQNTLSEEQIKSKPAFKQRIEQTEQAIRSQAGKLLPGSVYTGGPSDQKTPLFENFFAAIQSQNIFRVKVWSPSHQILWSNATEDIGKFYPENKEVTEALDGETAVELESHNTKGEQVSEHQYSGFTEVYVPIAGSDKSPIAVIEVYQAINDILDQGKRAFYATSALVVGASLLLVIVGLWSARPKSQTTAKSRSRSKK